MQLLEAMCLFVDDKYFMSLCLVELSEDKKQKQFAFLDHRAIAQVKQS